MSDKWQWIQEKIRNPIGFSGFPHQCRARPRQSKSVTWTETETKLLKLNNVTHWSSAKQTSVTEPMHHVNQLICQTNHVNHCQSSSIIVNQNYYSQSLWTVNQRLFLTRQHTAMGHLRIELVMALTSQLNWPKHWKKWTPLLLQKQGYTLQIPAKRACTLWTADHHGVQAHHLLAHWDGQLLVAWCLQV